MTDHRKRLTTLTDAHEYSNRDLLLDIAMKLHEVGDKLDAHLSAHSILNKVLTVGLPSLLAAFVALYLRR